MRIEKATGVMYSPLHSGSYLDELRKKLAQRLNLTFERNRFYKALGPRRDEKRDSEKIHVFTLSFSNRLDYIFFDIVSSQRFIAPEIDKLDISQL